MQLVNRYLIPNRIEVVVNELGFGVEYKPVYQRHIKINKGIENNIQFKLLNADQKPIDLENYTLEDSLDTPRIIFTAFDENNRKVLEKQAEIIPSDDSSIKRGLCRISISSNDLLNLKEQYLTYSLYLEDIDGNQTITYSNSHFEMAGIMYVSNKALPGPTPTYSVKEFFPYDSDSNNNEWYSEWISADPAINGNEALHTVAIYTNGYIGDITIQATLENQLDGNSESVEWADVQTISFDGSSEIEPVPANFNGIYSFLRFKANENPFEKITKILVRN
jgi:hypothetical protein